MIDQIDVTTALSVVHCGECGGTYAILKRYKERKKEQGGFWTCPYCKTGWGYRTENTDLEIARQEAKWANNRLATEKASHDQTKASLRAHKAAKTRLKKRVANGVCPCCKRHFENLQRHMQTKHPKYTETQ